LSELSPEDRLVIQWMDLEQRSAAEIAERTGWSRAAVKVRAFRARHRLRRIAKDLKKGTRNEAI
jgi:RNA polymerase sigma-70 factor (ECF subfamily)